MKKYITLDRIILVGLIILLLIGYLMKNRDYQSQKETITAMTLENQKKVDSVKNLLGETIYTQTALVTANQSTIKALSDSVFLLKNSDKKNRDIIAFYQGRTSTGFHDTTIIRYDSTYAHYLSDSLISSLSLQCQAVVNYLIDSSVTVGTPINDSTRDYRISATVNKEGLSITKLEFPDTINLQFVNHKGGLFRRKSIEIQFKHSNPYVQQTGNNSVFYQPKSKSQWFQKALLIGAGVFVGLKL